MAMSFARMSFARMWLTIGYVASIGWRARDGATRFAAHALKYGYEPRWVLLPASGSVVILDCSLPLGRCPSNPPPVPREALVPCTAQRCEAGR